jgi:predicted ATP-binding protein involved in virulence
MTAPQTTFRIDAMKLENYRCFPSCEFTLHPHLTIFVAENGQGKTAILDAIAVAIDSVISRLAYDTTARGFKSTDIHLLKGDKFTFKPNPPVSFSAEGFISGNAVSWNRSKNGISQFHRTTTAGLASLEGSISQLKEEIKKHSSKASPILPVAAFYGTGRLYGTNRLSKIRRSERAISQRVCRMV